MLSNKHFDPVAGSRLYNNYIEQYMLAEEVGVDGIMLNEHHNAPFCMQAKANIFAAILAGMTKKAKIVMLGNPLPLAENPIRLAEELAMIDMISKGRWSRASCAAAARSSSPPASTRPSTASASRRRTSLIVKGLDAGRARSASRARTISTAW
jgi:hypothetical protein